MNANRKYQRIMLTQPNFGWSGKRTWKLPPYALGLLNAALKKHDYQSSIYDPNFLESTEEEVRAELRRTQPDVVGITSSSLEYMQENQKMAQIIRDELPDGIIIMGGILPTVLPEKTLEDTNLDYLVIGEGEYRLPDLLEALNTDRSKLHAIDGLAWRENSKDIIQPMKEFITDLDAVDFPDYGDLDYSGYGNYEHKYTHYLLPRQFPYAITITSRGCPYRCIFCASATVSGRKSRFRSAENVLAEIDALYKKYGIKEFIFIDDHFLMDQARNFKIMNGLIERNYPITWKCGNVNAWHLNREILELMRKSGCYQFTISPESGNQHVLKNIVKKPGKLDKIPEIMHIAKELGFEVAANFVIGFPGETWEQIRDTCRYAENLEVDMVSFHLATPLPKTELMDICLREGIISIDETDDVYGYTKGVIETKDFKPMELQILRAFEWDRINFTDEKRKQSIARMEGITLEELEEWRIRTRRNLGVTVGWQEQVKKVG